MLLYLKISVILAVVGTALTFVATYGFGTWTAWARGEIFKGRRRHQAEYEMVYRWHRVCRWLFLVMLCITIVLIETMVRVAGEPFVLTNMHLVHYVLDFSFIVLLVCALWFNGKRDPDRHKIIIPWLAWNFVGVALTGTYLFIPFMIGHGQVCIPY